jgi:hypothetical protein
MNDYIVQVRRPHKRYATVLRTTSEAQALLYYNGYNVAYGAAKRVIRGDGTLVARLVTH